MIRACDGPYECDTGCGQWPDEFAPKLRKRRKPAYTHNTWHTCVYTASNGAAATNADTPALADSGVAYITNNHFLFQDRMTLVAAYASGAALSRARLDSNNVRYYGNPYVRPINQAALPGTNPNVMILWDNPFVLPPREEIAAQLSNTAGAPEREYLAMWLMLAYQPAPSGPFWAIRFTGTTAVVANTWSIEPYVLETGLASGTYNMVDLDCQSTNLVLARMFFDRQFYRPGVLGFNTLGNRAVDIWRPGILGVMNENPFVNDRLPALELLANAADAAFEGYFYIKPVSAPQVQQGGGMAGAVALGLPYRTGA
jgi:hypothetical protein